jgi:hypothetical protein
MLVLATGSDAARVLSLWHAELNQKVRVHQRSHFSTNVRRALFGRRFVGIPRNDPASPTGMATADGEPTVAQIDALPVGGFIRRGDTAYVRASRIDRTHVHYVCPFCWSALKKVCGP